MVTKNIDSCQGYLETIVDCVADGVFMVDNHKKITLCNFDAEGIITGFSKGEAIGKFCRDTFFVLPFVPPIAFLTRSPEQGTRLSTGL